MAIFKNLYNKLFDLFPYSRGFSSEIVSVLRLCIVIAFLFYWVEPFGIQCASTTHLIMFVFVAFLSALLNWSVAHFIVIRFIDTEKWTVLKDIIRSLIFLMINALALLWFASSIGVKLDTSLAIKFILYTFLVAIIPFYYRNLSINNSLLKKRLEEADRLNKLIGEKNVGNDDSNPIVIKSNIVNEALETDNKSILFIKAEKNYINAFLHKNGASEQVLLRISLVNTLQQFEDDYIIQCHRSYVVNIRHVSKVTGSSQGLKLTLLEHKVPVSKTYKEEVMKKIANLKK